MAFRCMGLIPIWCSLDCDASFGVSIKHGGIPCIKVFVPEETYVGATKIEPPCDAVSENSSIAISAPS